ncbi:MAG: tricarballylate dehydrogenase [Candidatus Rokubacteria bacterium RIFCSPHIGHO2_12_FULL_73_22]|nr:MAG: tricarballylate dehydrogenase [Candidatus Rokubacteria bacterium RIFCSPHIGHO2_02_FULL_73_26]OGL03900.1 MAG: tricarballylate dehydrogenase [Candidatus Rokubacteria bacterium RIFCSPHIGHO2_12_FULL_73_22]
MTTRYDVIVVGGGNAALCAALAAREADARVLVLEKAPEAWRGGNTFFTAGGFRFAFKSFEELCELVGDLSDEEKAAMDVSPYTEDEYYDDLMRVTEDLADPDLAMTLVRESQPTVRWMRDRGVRWIPMFGRQAYKVDGRFRFWGGLVLEAVGGGAGLVEMEYAAAAKTGIDVRFEAKVTRLTVDDRGAVTGVVVRTPGGVEELAAGAVVLAAGGFEANPEMRTRYLGRNWDLARVRGTPYNTGEAIRMALDIGALPWGHWSGCHAVAWDYNAPWHGDRKVGDGFQKHSYPLGLIVNLRGERFVDEGADFRNYTYVKYGRAIIEQPRRAAFQIFDQQVLHLLREEYRIREVTRAEDATLEGLARKLEIDVEGFVRTVREYNAAVQPGAYNPAVKDGKGTRGLTPPKSNWALPLDAPPFVGFAVTTGITFTFGGLRITGDAQVVDAEQRPIPGLYAAGELVGGLFYQNYPGGAGLMAGAVFGRIAGRAAARAAPGRRASG